MGTVVAAILIALTGCGGTDPAVPAAGEPVAGTTPATAQTEGQEGASDFTQPCTLLTKYELVTVFRDGTPEPDSASYGAGFTECVWEDSAGQIVRLSIVPPDNLQSDYIDQLNIWRDEAGIGEGSVVFAGVVGIGTAKSGGVTVAFFAGDVGVLVAVKTGDGTDQQADLVRATVLGQRLRSRAN